MSEGPKKKDTLFCAIVGVLVSILLVLAPDVLPAIVGREGYVWTPINSPLYRFGDNYYYSAWVVELIHSGIPPGSPSAAEYANTPLLETLRWFPLAVAALPAFIFDDYRIVYLTGYAITAAAYFLIPFYLCHRLTASRYGAAMVGFLVLFGVGEYWSGIPLAAGFPGSQTLKEWIFKLLATPLRGATNIASMYEYEALQGSFRYINLSISGPILLAYVALCHIGYANNKPAWIPILALLAMSPCMAFSYPSHVFIGYAALVGYAFLAALRGHRHSATILLSIACLTAATLLLGGYVEYVRSVYAANELWNNIFHRESMELVPRSVFAMLLLAVINKYSLTLSLALWLVWKYRELRDMTLLIGAIGCGLALTALFDMPQLWSRFLGRGIDHLWVMCIAVCCTYGLSQAVATTRARSNLWLKSALKLVVLIPVFIIPAIGFGSNAVHSSKNLTRFMPEGRWAALQWINNNLSSGANLAALDWDDITFVPIYTSANLVVDNMIIGGRGPVDELTRYLALWKILGLPRDVLEGRLTTMVEAASKRFASTRAKLFRPPLASPEDYASGQIAEAVLYWPYVQRIGGLQVSENGSTARGFVQWAMLIFDQVDAIKSVDAYQIETVMLSGTEIHLPLSPVLPLTPLFESDTHRFFKISN